MTKILFPNLMKAEFLNRVNRFIANVSINGTIESVHVPSTGRLDGVLTEGVTCYLKPAENKNRKTKYTLFLVQYMNTMVCIDALIANDFSHQLLKDKMLIDVEAGDIHREVSLEKDRIDFALFSNRLVQYIEVKSVNKVEQGIACFPDAPTERGRKHIKTLIKLQAENHIQSHILFIVQRNDAKVFTPCIDRDPVFAELLTQAYNRHVKIHVALTNVTVEGIFFDKWLNINFVTHETSL